MGECVCVRKRERERKSQTTHLVTGDWPTGVCVAFGLTPVAHTRGAGTFLPVLAMLPGHTDTHLDKHTLLKSLTQYILETQGSF